MPTDNTSPKLQVFLVNLYVIVTVHMVRNPSKRERNAMVQLWGTGRNNKLGLIY